MRLKPVKSKDHFMDFPAVTAIVIQVKKLASKLKPAMGFIRFTLRQVHFRWVFKKDHRAPNLQNALPFSFKLTSRR